MDARRFRTDFKATQSFPPILMPGETSFDYQSEPKLDNNNVLLSVTKQLVFYYESTNRRHVVLTVESEYKIPVNEIKSRADVYEFYRDAMLGLNEAYEYVRKNIHAALLKGTFPTPPIENYNGEIDQIFSLLNSRN